MHEDTGMITRGSTMILAQIAVAELTARLGRIAMPPIAAPGDPPEVGLVLTGWTAWGTQVLAISSAHIDWSVRLGDGWTADDAIADVEARILAALNRAPSQFVSLAHPGEYPDEDTAAADVPPAHHLDA